MINISKIINDENVNKDLPTQFNKTEQISTVYTLTKTILYKIFNHKESVKALDTKNISENMKNLPSNCTTSLFTGPNHDHIVTGDCQTKVSSTRYQSSLTFQIAKLK